MNMQVMVSMPPASQSRPRRLIYHRDTRNTRLSPIPPEDDAAPLILHAPFCFYLLSLSRRIYHIGQIIGVLTYLLFD